MHVDEARSDNEIACLDRPARLPGRHPANGDNAVALDGDIATEPRIARAIHDAAANQEQVVNRR